MKYTAFDTGYILKIEKGEEVVNSLTQFCEEQKIHNASVSGIGAVEWMRCGFYDLQKREYYFKEYTGLFEVLSATGNILLKNGNPFLHMHATFSDEENKAFGGHVDAMRVGVVLEMVIQILPSHISRSYDEDIGLFLMDID